MEKLEEYKDIIGLDHHVLPVRPKMKSLARAAQFAPFAALSGYEEMVREQSRYVDSKPILSEGQLERLDELLTDALKKPEQELEITYFIKDEKKDGGKCASCLGRLTAIDSSKKVIILNEKIKIKAEDVLDIEVKRKNDRNEVRNT